MSDGFVGGLAGGMVTGIVAGMLGGTVTGALIWRMLRKSMVPLLPYHNKELHQLLPPAQRSTATSETRDADSASECAAQLTAAPSDDPKSDKKYDELKLQLEAELVQLRTELTALRDRPVPVQVEKPVAIHASIRDFASQKEPDADSTPVTSRDPPPHVLQRAQSLTFSPGKISNAALSRRKSQMNLASRSWARSLTSPVVPVPRPRGVERSSRSPLLSKHEGNDKVEAVPIIVLTDMGGAASDAGDTAALIMLRGLEGLGFVSMRAVLVATPDDAKSTTRASDVAVANMASLIGHLDFECCTVGVCKNSNLTQVEIDNMAARHVSTIRIVSAETALHEALTDPAVADHSLVIACLASTADLARFLQRHGDAAAQKLLSVTMLGAVVQEADALASTGRFLQPDPTYAPYANHLATVEFCYRKLQDLNVSMKVVARHTAYASPVRARMYDDLGWISTLQLVRDLGVNQRRAVEELWVKVNAPIGSKRRGTLPERCNVTWFADVLCNGTTPHAETDVWTKVCNFALYDAVAIVASIPELHRRYFFDDEKYQHHGHNTTHLLYGSTELTHGVRAPGEMRDLIESSTLMGVSMIPAPSPVIIFTDPGQDLDDELALILLRDLVERNYVRPIAVVANLHPAKDRARLAKGTLKELGLGHVPVAIGSDGGCTSNEDLFSATAYAYLADISEVEEDAEGLLRRVLALEDAGTVLMVCLSSLTDASLFLKQNETLFVEKIHSVTIMGGVVVPSHHEEATVEDLLQPDSANNNTFDIEAARFFYTRLQQMRIRCNVLTRLAAYAAPVPRDIYDTMVQSESKIALRLFDVQRKSIEDLWKRCNAQGTGRRGLPDRCDSAWYRKTFLGSKGEDRAASDSIWDLVQQFNMYDPMALILAVPSLAWMFFEYTCPSVPAGGSLRLVGKTADACGVKDPQMLRDFIVDGLTEGVNLSLRGEQSNDRLARST